MLKKLGWSDLCMWSKTERAHLAHLQCKKLESNFINHSMKCFLKMHVMFEMQHYFASFFCVYVKKLCSYENGIYKLKMCPAL